MPINVPSNVKVLPPEEFKLERLLPLIVQEIPTGEVVSSFDDTGLSADDLAAKRALEENRQVNVWVALARGMQELYKDNVDSWVGQLIRDIEINPETEQTSVNGTMRMLGFDIAEELLVNINSGNMQALAQQLPMFADYSSTDSFVKFIGLLLNGHIRLGHLYTDDYIAFETAPRGPLLHQGGNWFKTTHISLMLDWLGYQNSIVALNGDFNTALARRLIDEYVPINLVIEYFGFYVKATAYVDVQAIARQGPRRASAHAGPQDCKLDRVVTVRSKPSLPSV